MKINIEKIIKSYIYVSNVCKLAYIGTMKEISFIADNVNSKYKPIYHHFCKFCILKLKE